MACELCGVKIRAEKREDVVRMFKDFTPIYTVNLEFLYWAQVFPGYREILNRGLTTADGRWVAWLCRLSGNRVEHLPGSELVHDFLGMAVEEELRIMFVGGRQSIYPRLRRRLEELYPGLNYRLLDPGEVTIPLQEWVVEEVGEKIKELEPHMVFVALGPPKQELFIDALRTYAEEAGVSLAIGIGGAIDMLAGVERPAPKLLRILGLEWLWRLTRNPKRIKKVKRSLKAVKAILSRRASP